ncbi:MAG: LysM peptidoglycan-binding domain-containing protein [Anaerolineae bacterium]|nr:LysM peptidoglycan-binding domain-containing protein [Anaerolineae bacterium]
MLFQRMSSRKSRFVTIILLSTLLIFASIPITAQEEPTPTPVLSPPDPVLLQEVYDRINTARARYGLPPYRWNASLTAAAQNQAEWLVGTHSRAHFRPDGSSPSRRALSSGFPAVNWCCGENFYMSIDATPQLVVNWWIGSINHVVNIMHRDFTDIGIGMSSDGYRTSYVTVFGELADPNAPPPVAEQPPESQPLAPPPEIPAPVTGAQDLPPGQVVYVASGDTLAAIALRHGVSLSALAAANQIANPNLIYPGQQLILPGT